MSPKLVFTALFILFATICQSQENTHLSGDVTILLKKKSLTASYVLTNITVDSPKMSFMLHEDFDVEQAYLNGDPIASSKNGRDCESCKVHTIWIDRPLTTTDTLKIAVDGSLDNFTPKRSEIEIGTADKWYPVILEESAKTSGDPFASNTYSYTYDFKLRSGDSKTILIDGIGADNKGNFHSVVPNSNILLNLSSRQPEDLSHTEESTQEARIVFGE
ncbi:hypothetical protein [Flavimarina sp. Hel_I_48]|uniref:hypothetical protein n=1 Tax=Flavimarina sp. Hel_I_48 TaxID=1392488 RepID=UPI0004DEDA50|nr:hypothetical protein [Flavimarina sp. Hel_I_48]